MTVHPAVVEAVRVAAELIERRKFVGAEVVLRRSLALMPDSPELWCNLGTALWNQRRPIEAHEALERALALRHEYSLTFGTLGLVYEALGRFDDAEEALTRSVALDPNYMEAPWDRSLLRIAVGDHERGFAEYETRIARNPKLYQAYALPRWRGESMSGERVLVVSEQGYGDTIFFSRFLPRLAEVAEKVYVAASLTMVQLLWEFRHIVEFLPDGVPLPDADRYIFMGSLPCWSGLRSGEYPLDPGFIARRVDWQHGRNTMPLPRQQEAEDGFKVGICWTGNPGQERNDERTIPLEELSQLAAEPMVWLYSLQHGPAGDDVARFGLEDLIVDLRPAMDVRGFVGTGCLMRQLDLVVTCCTSVAHLAGALGVPCWVLLCSDPYWIWGFNDDEHSRWYPSIRLFRQSLGETWRSVVDRVRGELGRVYLDDGSSRRLLLAAE